MAAKFQRGCIVHWKDTKRWCGLPFSFTHYSIVENPGKWIKLFIEKGFFTTQIEEVHLFKIDDFSVYESMTNKIFGVGSIEVWHNDSSSLTCRLVRIKRPYEVFNLLSELVEKAKKDKNMFYTEFQRQ